MHIEDSVLSNQEFFNIKSILTDLQNLYPDILSWWVKCYGEFRLGTRVCYRIYKRDRLIGFSVVKLGSVNKICTLYIVEGFRYKGYGYWLFDHIQRLYDNIEVSVSQENLHLYERMFNKFGLNVYKITTDQYRKGKKEFYFKRVTNYE